MEQVTLKIPDNYTDKLKFFAQCQNQTIEEVIMDIICKAVETGKNDMSRENDCQMADPLFADDEVFAGEAPEDLSLKHDDYLYGETL